MNDHATTRQRWNLLEFELAQLEGTKCQKRIINVDTNLENKSVCFTSSCKHVCLNFKVPNEIKFCINLEETFPFTHLCPFPNSRSESSYKMNIKVGQ